MFGDLVGGIVRLNACGQIVEDEWLRTPVVRPKVMLDAFVVMPNHFHAIVILKDERPVDFHQQAFFGNMVAGSVASLVGQFKAVVTKRINRAQGASGIRVWQRNYFERILRDDRELNRARRYIGENPARWHTDWENPSLHR